MSAMLSRRQRDLLARENMRWPVDLAPIPRDEWPSFAAMTLPPVGAWRSREFLVQLFEASGDVMRLSITRTDARGERWRDGISWDDIQRLKREAGFGEHWAVEVFPAEGHVVNVANMRHVWLLDAAPEYAWQSLPELSAAVGTQEGQP